jgi:hypothetical protein
MFIYSLKIKTLGHVIKYYDTLFRYDIIPGIHLYRLDPGAHMRCIRFLFHNWRSSEEEGAGSGCAASR